MKINRPMTLSGQHRPHRASLLGRLPMLWKATTALLLLTATGCTSLTNPIHGIPASRVPSELFPPEKNNLVPIDLSLLALEPPRSYQLDAGDILGIYIEGVLPFNTPDAPPQPPPVHFPEGDSTLPPSVGYPFAVAEDGTLSLPLIAPIDVRGLTLDQVRERVRRTYIDEQILREEKARPVVTLIQERTYNIIVVRQDNAGGGGGGGAIGGTTDESATGRMVKLPAYQNDVLHALVATGGLPGVNAKNEVKVLRASKADKRKRALFVQQFYQHQAAVACDPCACPPELPEDPTVLRIPLRLPPAVVPTLTDDDIRLEDGDIVYIESRETEFYYTGGLLPAGQHLLPRDYDLDVLGAMAIAGTGIGSPGQRGGGGGGGGMGGAQALGGVPPGKLVIIRETDCNGQVIIEVDLNRAINDPRSRPLVQPGDVLILQFKCEEELLNFGIGTFFTFGIRELLQN